MVSIWQKKASYRAAHRGGKEADHLFSTFMEQYGNGYGETELKMLGDLFLHDDVDLYDWLRGVTPVPPIYDGPVFWDLRHHFETLSGVVPVDG